MNSMKKLAINFTFIECTLTMPKHQESSEPVNNFSALWKAWLPKGSSLECLRLSSPLPLLNSPWFWEDRWCVLETCIIPFLSCHCLLSLPSFLHPINLQSLGRQPERICPWETSTASPTASHHLACLCFSFWPQGNSDTSEMPENWEALACLPKHINMGQVSHGQLFVQISENISFWVCSD